MTGINFPSRRKLPPKTKKDGQPMVASRFRTSVANAWGELRRYPSAIIGLAVIGFLFVVSIYVVITIPIGTAIDLWRGGEDVWYQNPKFAAPSWFNWFSSDKLPVSFAVNSAEGEMEKTVTRSETSDVATFEFKHTFDYIYDHPPQDIILYFDSQIDTKLPFVSVTLFTPDGREIRLADMAIERTQTLRVAQDPKLQKKLRTLDQVMQALFTNPDAENPAEIVRGEYTVVVTGTTFEADANMDVDFVLHGQLFGWAGTDQYRRDLMLPLLWGTPIALIFGLLAAVGTSFMTMIIAAVGVWFGGWIDELIQRITEINLILPFLAILIMVGTLYSRSIWTILGVTVLLSIFSGNIKAYRAIFLQTKVAPYIEAARAYGTSNTRIIFNYLIPRMIPILIPTLVFSIPSFVFLEASLAVLGIGDPVLPTWGKVIENAYTNGALYRGLYYWVLEPAVLLMVTGFGFALLGFALDRVFNPRLRDI